MSAEPDFLAVYTAWKYRKNITSNSSKKTEGKYAANGKEIVHCHRLISLGEDNLN